MAWLWRFRGGRRGGLMRLNGSGEIRFVPLDGEAWEVGTRVDKLSVSSLS
jgi:hypothetical protein